ncbi:MAG TPA: insulinase family protein, partial [Campylobacter avium]|nr:insulinase family protein [Campylobacter avium]
ISEYELTQAKNFLLGSSCLHYESLAKRLDVALSEFYKGLKIGHLKEELKLIEKTNLKDLNSFLKEQEKLSKVVFASVLNAN